MSIQKFGNLEVRSQELRKYQISFPGRGDLGRTWGPSHKSKVISSWFRFPPKKRCCPLFLQGKQRNAYVRCCRNCLRLQNRCWFQPWRRGTFLMTPYRKKIDLVETTWAWSRSEECMWAYLKLFRSLWDKRENISEARLPDWRCLPVPSFSQGSSILVSGLSQEVPRCV